MAHLRQKEEWKERGAESLTHTLHDRASRTLCYNSSESVIFLSSHPCSEYLIIYDIYQSVPVTRVSVTSLIESI